MEEEAEEHIFWNPDIWVCLQKFLTLPAVHSMSCVCRALFKTVWNNIRFFRFIDDASDDLISHYLSRAPSLRVLILRSCTFSGACFAVGHRLPCLLQLDISHTLVTGVVFSQLLNCKKLERIDMSFCEQMSDDALVQLQQITSLKSLNLNHNKISDCTPLEKLTNLESLDLMYCEKLSAKGTACFAELTRLKNLNLRFCKDLTDESISHLKGLTNMKSLFLSFCKKLTTKCVYNFQLMSNLTSLSLNSCRFDTDPENLYDLRFLTNLRELWLNYSCVGDIGLSHVATLTKLEDFGICGCDATDEGISVLRPLYNLRRLQICGNKLTDPALENLQLMTQLRDLDASDCPFMGHTFASLPVSIKELDLNNTKIDLQGLGHLKHFTKLKILFMGECSRIEDQGLAYIARLTKLKTLSFRVSNLSGAGLHHLDKLSRLSSLNLRGAALKAEHVEQALPALTSLEDLELANTEVTDASLIPLSLLTNLKYLNLSNCTQLTGAVFKSLASLTKLEYINMVGSNKVIESDLYHLKKLTLLEELALEKVDVKKTDLESLEPGVKRFRELPDILEEDVPPCPEFLPLDAFDLPEDS